MSSVEPVAELRAMLEQVVAPAPPRPEVVVRPTVEESARAVRIASRVPSLSVARTQPRLAPSLDRESSPGIADATYYGARELDVYPALAAPLTLGRLQSSIGPADAHIQLLLLIAHTGVVEEVTVVSAAPVGPLAEQARQAFVHALFMPGERGGRRVKSRVLVEVSFGAER